jgi:hypothetical protein
LIRIKLNGGQLKKMTTRGEEDPPSLQLAGMEREFSLPSPSLQGLSSSI